MGRPISEQRFGPAVIVLDTHAWIRWLHPELGPSLPPKLREWLESVETPFAVSIISCLEVSQLVKKKRIELPMPLPQWFDVALQDSGITYLSLSPGLIHASTQLPDIHLDPADRIIIATAQERDAYLLTRDENIRRYPNLQTVWDNPPGM
ncbi:MAG: type II toxin-antitoxin system VapC family toxin [Methylococcales bacterium]